MDRITIRYCHLSITLFAQCCNLLRSLRQVRAPQSERSRVADSLKEQHEKIRQYLPHEDVGKLLAAGDVNPISWRAITLCETAEAAGLILASFSELFDDLDLSEEENQIGRIEADLQERATFIANLLHVSGVEAPPETKPSWDKNKRELRLGTVLVKRYKQTADNQFRVLDEFQADGWPPEIGDPLPHRSGRVPAKAIKDAIDGLNARQDGPRKIIFGGNGKANGITWRISQS